jgi:hypothetical protein
LDRTADTLSSPPGIVLATVTVSIPGSEDLTIVGRVTTPAVTTPVMPVSIGSLVIGIVEPPLDLSVEIP